MEDLFIALVLCFLFIFGVNFIQHEQEKEMEILKKNKEYIIHKQCIEFDGEWYCYD